MKVLGLNLARLTPDLRSKYGIVDAVNGVLITGVNATAGVLITKQDGTAATLSAGDVITDVWSYSSGRVPVSIPAHVQRLKGKEQLIFRVSNADGEWRIVVLIEQ
ncbi:hypothetical protein ACFLEY_07265 [Bradyrhizobium sp. YCK136]|uniref:hypothetical protein n=1 Tax=Bradyrhizobium sp. YCK136 TaxID=3351346 RepID=UPI0037C7FA3E